MTTEKKPQTRIVTPKFRASYANVFKPKASMNGGEPKYSIQMLFDKKTNIDEIKKLVARAAAEKFGPDWQQMAKEGKIMWPIKDGDKLEKEETLGQMVMNASTKFAPEILDGTKGKAPIFEDDREGFYSGCYAHASISCYPWEHKAPGSQKVLKRGISFNLHNLLKIGDGAKFGTRSSATDDFASVEGYAGDSGNFNDDGNDVESFM